MRHERVISVSDVGFRRLITFLSLGEPSTRRCLNRLDSQDSEFCRQTKRTSCENRKTAIYWLPIYSCVPPCLQSSGDVCVEGLEQENAFPRNSFKGDKTQFDNVVFSLLLPHLPHPQQELKVKLPLKLGVSKLS